MFVRQICGMGFAEHVHSIIALSSVTAEQVQAGCTCTLAQPEDIYSSWKPNITFKSNQSGECFMSHGLLCASCHVQPLSPHHPTAVQQFSSPQPKWPMS